MSASTWQPATNRGPGRLPLLLAALAVPTVAIAWWISPFILVALALGIPAGLTFLRWPWLGYALLVLSVPFQQLGAVPAGGAAVSLTQLSFALALVSWFLAATMTRQPLQFHAVLIPFAVLTGIMLFSGLIAQDGRAALAETSRWAVTILAFIVGLQFVLGQSERRVIALIGVLALCGFFEASFGVVQSVLALGPSSFQLESGASRAFGTFGKPNSYAGFLEVVLFPTAWLGVHFLLQIPAAFRDFRDARVKGVLASRDQRWQLILTIALSATFLFLAGITLSGIVASLSRGAWLGVAAAAFVTAFLFHRLVRLSIVAIVAGLALLLLTGSGGLIPEDLRDRATNSVEEFRLFDASSITITPDNFAAVERMAHWQAGWNMWEDHPLLGVGAGNFNERYDDYYVREGLRVSRGHAHNYYIHTLAETGLAGLLAYLTLIGSLGGLALWTVLKAPQGIERMVALGGLGTMTSVAVHNVFENLHVLNIGITMGLVWVLIVWAHQRWRTSDAGMNEDHVDRRQVRSA